MATRQPHLYAVIHLTCSGNPAVTNCNCCIWAWRTRRRSAGGWTF